VLTDAKGVNRVVTHRLSDQMAELHQDGREVILVSSGAVACGVQKVGLRDRPRTIPQKQAAAAVGQTMLMEAWEEGFRKWDLLVGQVLLTSEGLDHRHRYLNAKHTLQSLLDWRIVPVINENDTVVVDEIKFGDNDQLSAEIAGLTGADLVILLTDTEGLYDCDPRSHAGARLIHTVDRVDREIEACVGSCAGRVGTGGMTTKLHAARKCLAMGVPLIIAHGRERDVLLRLIGGERIGTLFVPRQPVYSGKKLWLANLRHCSGDLVIDEGAVRALTQRGKSLLPIGVKIVRGSFGPGAPVRCLAESGALVGVGLTNYPSGEIDIIKGHHSEDLEKLLGYRHSDEVVHRDNFVLADETVEVKRGRMQ
jgi:glutamate 5-kinase